MELPFPLELREKIYWEFVKTQIKEKERMGWGKIHQIIKCENCQYYRNEKMTNPIMLAFGFENSDCGFCYSNDEDEEEEEKIYTGLLSPSKVLQLCSEKIFEAFEAFGANYFSKSEGEEIIAKLGRTCVKLKG